MDIYRAVAARHPVPYPVERLGEIRLFGSGTHRTSHRGTGSPMPPHYYARMSGPRACRISESPRCSLDPV